LQVLEFTRFGGIHSRNVMCKKDNRNSVVSSILGSVACPGIACPDGACPDGACPGIAYPGERVTVALPGPE
jgi:hypothetical protein